mmetsp:Transcript_18544/g.21328  ORF Transcript_18544/g.21328 Transcript_18544/m.21328 type:complete len:163 (-) Transcript_18544:150-638(-)|eukprot:CAMPEP_0194148464 /NCGR_PEP_ID=MMETSP0152-20130528/32612_1 /TAXON_ID=1049557 /ORGANISM="Thalassiothrix antarctica, Strain L6-D1" /LENGTH=162 /DNA_ID=CAMNT_0038850039 /DNA_START=41 /DNA_END=529 /DNA_ORIENTATION=-
MTSEIRKRKHYDEVAQMFADEEDCWKKQRSLPSSSSHFRPVVKDDDDDVEFYSDEIYDQIHLPVSSMETDDGFSCCSNATIVTASTDNSNNRLGDVDVTRISSSSQPDNTTITTTTNTNSSWAMSDLKDWRQKQPSSSLTSPFDARRNMVRLWNNNYNKTHQ